MLKSQQFFFSRSTLDFFKWKICTLREIGLLANVRIAFIIFFTFSVFFGRPTYIFLFSWRFTNCFKIIYHIFELFAVIAMRNRAYQKIVGYLDYSHEAPIIMPQNSIEFGKTVIGKLYVLIKYHTRYIQSCVSYWYKYLKVKFVLTIILVNFFRYIFVTKFSIWYS